MRICLLLKTYLWVAAWRKDIERNQCGAFHYLLTATFLSSVLWDATFRDNDFETHLVIVHGTLCTVMKCCGYAAFLLRFFFPSSMLGCFFPCHRCLLLVCLEYIFGCKASDTPAHQNICVPYRKLWLHSNYYTH